MPSIRFRASKPIGDDAGSGLETQALVSQRVALELNDRLLGFQRDGILPTSQTCDLIILDRCAFSCTLWLEPCRQYILVFNLPLRMECLSHCLHVTLLLCMRA